MIDPLDARVREVLPEHALAGHDQRVFSYRSKRDRAAGATPEFAQLTRHAQALKTHVLDHLDVYLERFERAAQARGAVVHWAQDADAHNRIVHELLAERGVERVVKSKSMLTEECGLNPYLEARGVSVVDTDLGERIVQLAGEPPSHIILPAIHKSASEIGQLFHERMNGAAGERDPTRLTHHARAELRAHFLAAEAGITGVNFAVASTGSVVVCTNEGNADLGMSLPRLHVACMGIEKLVPDLADLAVFLRLLARSATGQSITTYTSVVSGPRPGGELHIVLVDNGRSRLLADTEQRASLGCIRCGACLNTCPVYRRAGGHAYGLTVAGPIGLALAPARGGASASQLPLASSLCGSCSQVCPVGIPLHEQLLAWRRRAGPRGRARRTALALAARLARRAAAVEGAGRVVRWAWPLLAKRWQGNPLTPWLAAHDLPERPERSFRSWQRQRGGRA